MYDTLWHYQIPAVVFLAWIREWKSAFESAGIICLSFSLTLLPLQVGEIVTAATVPSTTKPINYGILA